MPAQRRRDFEVSGCDANMRLTARDRGGAAARSRPPAARPGSAASSSGSSTCAQTGLDVRPFVDFAPRRIFFPAVGARVAIEPMRRATAMARILDAIHDRHAIAGADDARRLLDYVGGLRRLARSLRARAQPPPLGPRRRRRLRGGGPSGRRSIARRRRRAPGDARRAITRRRLERALSPLRGRHRRRVRATHRLRRRSIECGPRDSSRRGIDVASASFDRRARPPLRPRHPSRLQRPLRRPAPPRHGAPDRGAHLGLRTLSAGASPRW